MRDCRKVARNPATSDASRAMICALSWLARRRQHGHRQVGAGPVFDPACCPRDFDRGQPFGQPTARTQSPVTVLPYARGGKREPLQRLDLVLRHALSTRIENTQVVHSRGISLLRAAQEPAPSDGEILRDIL